VTGTSFTHVKTRLNFGDSHENVFDMYGASREKLWEILAVVMISSPGSSVRGIVKRICMCVCVCECVCGCVCVYFCVPQDGGLRDTCVCVCVRVCVRLCVSQMGHLWDTHHPNNVYVCMCA